jgi:hypothetical protein
MGINLDIKTSWDKFRMEGIGGRGLSVEEVYALKILLENETSDSIYKAMFDAIEKAIVNYIRRKKIMNL